MVSVFHVAITGSDSSDGSEARPLRTIDRAAGLARAGDTVVVHEGEYREWVRPRRGGLSDTRRITYRAAAGEHVVIKGSEPVRDWQQVEGPVWTASVPNSVFGAFNPFAEEIDGDWIVHPAKDSPRKHLGDVYLNGRSLYEVLSRAEVAHPLLRTEVLDDRTGTMDRIRDPEQTRHVWYAEVGDEATTVWANFQDADPNAELVEINVRRSIFYPTEHHLDYITVRGFELASVESFSQGGAYVNNLVCGTVALVPVLDRATPYHLPHSTQVAGYAVIYGADDRWVGNVFLGGDVDRAYVPGSRVHDAAGHGTAAYAGHPASFSEYLARVDERPEGDHERYPKVRQAAYLRSNVYLAGARPADAEQDAAVLDGEASVDVVVEGAAVDLRTRLPEGFDAVRIEVVTGPDLERVRFVDADFEEPDGTPAVLDVDLLGDRKERGQGYPAGPVSALRAGPGSVRVWPV